MQLFLAQKVSAFTTYQRAIYTALCGLYLFFLGRYISWWFNPTHVPSNWHGQYIHLLDFAIFTLLTFVVFSGAIQRLGSFFAMWHMAKPKPQLPQAGLRVALLTCYVPGKEPLDMLVETLKAMKAVRYEHDCWVLDEGGSSEVKNICQILDVKYFTRAGIAKYNQESGKFRTKTKAGNHNAWADAHARNYDIIAQIDMDHEPEPDFFEKTLGYFRDPQVAFIGSPQFYKNTENWIAKGAAEQAFAFHGPMQQGFYGCDMPFLIGTSHIYRQEAMEAIGGYAPTIVEDHLTGMNFFASGYKGVYVPTVLARGEGPLNWVDYFNQQMRWSYGLFEILFRHTPKLFLRLKWRQKINYLISQLYYFGGVAVVFGFFLTLIYLVMGINSASMSLLIWSKYAFPPFLIANLIQLYTHRFSIDPKNEPTFGFLGMFLNMGANIIYALAFIKFLTRQKLRYMVTQKGQNAKNQRVPLSTFNWHLLLAALMAAAFAVSFYTGNSAVQLRFWAVFNIVVLAAVAISPFWQKIEKVLSHLRFLITPAKITFNFSLVLIVALCILFSLTNQYDANVKAAFETPSVIANPANEPLAGKVTAPANGAYLGMSLYQHNDTDYLASLEDETGKNFAVVNYYQSWGVADNRFDSEWAKNIDKNGSVPMVSWEPWKPVSGFDRSASLVNQPEYHLDNIITGTYDDYIRQYAKDVKNYRKPVMIRFAHEMNGNWYPWGSSYNKPGDYVLAWRHVHEIFDEEGATNVTWVWSPNEPYSEKTVPNSDNLSAFYPGDDYVDWVGFSAFNWAGVYKQNVWKSPSVLYEGAMSQLSAYNKPIMITETATADTENPDQKAQWIKNLATYLQTHQQIKGIVWFNAEDNGVNWTINSNQSSIDAFNTSFGDYFIQKIK